MVFRHRRTIPIRSRIRSARVPSRPNSATGELDASRAALHARPERLVGRVRALDRDQRPRRVGIPDGFAGPGQGVDGLHVVRVRRI